ncbi:hypothetical protein BH18ACT1_BH18ACT1_06350 [soil metagenome]
MPGVGERPDYADAKGGLIAEMKARGERWASGTGWAP